MPYKTRVWFEGNNIYQRYIGGLSLKDILYSNSRVRSRTLWHVPTGMRTGKNGRFYEEPAHDLDDIVPNRARVGDSSRAKNISLAHPIARNYLYVPRTVVAIVRVLALSHRLSHEGIFKNIFNKLYIYYIII